MKYFIVIILFGVFIHSLSFAKYNWDKKNALAAVGAAILGVAAFILPLIVLFSRHYEG